ncbi:MAG: 2Fe-2S iron-sulfur cluster-binding protein [Kiritimatiellia bacterium]
MSETIHLTIDGIPVEARRGQTILEAADAAGIYIPRLCAHKDLVPFGACRICTVMVNGRPQTACTQPVVEGMVVENNIPELRKYRANLIEMLLVEGNHFCMFCEKSGNCELQALAYRFGILAPKYPYMFPQRELDASHPHVLLERNRCILCARCVRASRDIDGRHVFDFIGRGSRRQIAVNAQTGLSATELRATDKACDVCPVGSIIRKNTAYRIPIGARRYDQEAIGSDIEKKEGKIAGTAHK